MTRFRNTHTGGPLRRFLVSFLQLTHISLDELTIPQGITRKKGGSWGIV
jgi:hypothetical protein